MQKRNQDNLKMAMDALTQYGERVHDYFYVLEEDLQEYRDSYEIVEYNGMLIKISTMKPVKVFNPEKRTFA